MSGRPRKDLDATQAKAELRGDGLWHAWVTMGRKPGGQRVRRHVKRRTEAEAVRAVRELERLRDSGRYVWSETAALTVEGWLEHWLEAQVRPHLKPKTFASYASAMRRHVIPHLGHRPLRAVTKEEVETLYAQLAATGLGAHAIRSVHRTLRAAYSEAIESGRAGHNPVTKSKVPGEPRVDHEPLRSDEVQRVVEAAQGDPMEARWLLGLIFGLRQGEVLGLILDDVDLEHRILHVRRTLQRNTWRHGCMPVGVAPSCGHKRAAECPKRFGGGLVAVETKTQRSKRGLPIPAPLVPLLEARMKQVKKERLRAGDAWVDGGWLFCDGIGQPLDPRRDWGAWKDLLGRAEVRDVRVHDLRHTAATTMLVQGADVRTVASMMGWSSLAMADRYTHAVSEALVAAADRMASVVQVSSTEAG